MANGELVADLTYATITPAGGSSSNLADVVNGATDPAALAAFGATYLAWLNSLPPYSTSLAVGTMCNNGGMPMKVQS